MVCQAPVTLRKEVNGFIINRLQYALLMEAWRLVEDGVASPEDIDTSVTQGLGMRWSIIGPFETIDMNAPNGWQLVLNRGGEEGGEKKRRHFFNLMCPSVSLSLFFPKKKGVNDYCDRYGENITAVCREQEDTRDMKGTPTAAAINDAMRSHVPLDQLAVRTHSK